MDELDLRDHRGRLRRLVAAIAIGLALAILLLQAIRSVAVRPNADPVSGASVGLLGIAMAVVASVLVHAALAAIARRRR